MCLFKCSLNFVLKAILVELVIVILIRYYQFKFSLNQDSDGLEEKLEQYHNYSSILKSAAAKSLPSSGFLFCYVLNTTKNLKERASPIQETWLERCDHGQFFTSSPLEASIPFTQLFQKGTDIKRDLFHTTITSFRYAHHVSRKFDWYLQAGDETYIIIEHLKKFLKSFNPNRPIFIDFSRDSNTSDLFNAGYVLSRAAVKFVAEELYSDFQSCSKEDYYFAKCLETRNIQPKRTVDCWNRNLFHSNTLKHAIEVPAVHETWLKRCDHGQFFTSEPILSGKDIPFTTLFRSMNDSHDMLFYKTIKAFHFAYTQISDKFEWYLKADDDSYIFVDHLKKYLSTLNSSEPLYLGYTWPSMLRKGYNSGGGYLLSNAAVKIFVEKLYGNRTACPFHIAEDLGLGWCLQNKNIFPFNTRDGNGKLRFFYDNIIASIWGKWSISPDVSMIHYNSPDDIRMIDYIYFNINDPKTV